MARDESHREDLLREATALVERIEIVSRSNGDSAVAGFRSDGALSIFFGEDPVYQFNAAGELRRAYCDGKLLKAASGQLVELQRVRTENEVQLVRRELSEVELAAFLERMADYIRKFAAAFPNGFEIVGQVPANADVLGRLQAWLKAQTRWSIAMRPNV